MKYRMQHSTISLFLYFANICHCFIQVVPPELYNLKSSSDTFHMSEFTKDPASSPLRGTTTPKIMHHEKLSFVKWVTKIVPKNSPSNTLLSLHAEVASYRLLKAITTAFDVPLVPVFPVMNDQNEIVGNAQPLVNHRHERLDISDFQVTAPTADDLNSIKVFFRQHWLDVFLEDFDDNYGNWLMMSSSDISQFKTLPVRIDHGWALIDPVTGRNMARLFKRQKRVFSDVFCHYNKMKWVSDLNEVTIQEISKLLQSTITKPLLQTIFMEFFQKDSSQKLNELVELFFKRSQNFIEYANQNQEKCLN